MNQGLEEIRLMHITTVPHSFCFFTGQIGYMQKLGFQIHALSSPGKQLTEFSERERVSTYPVKMLRQISPLQDLWSIAQIWWHLKKVRPTIVHSHTPKGGLLGTIAAWLARTPVRIYHIRGLPLMTATGYKRVLLYWSEKIACLLADQVLCVSHSIREVAIAENLCPSSKIKVLLGGSGNGVDAFERFNPAQIEPGTRQAVRQKYGIPDDALVIGFVGRLVRDKGIQELIDAWVTLREEFSNLHLLIVGPFESQDAISESVEKLLKADNRIHLTGEDWNTPPLYVSMDMLVLPTYREGLGNVLLEAGAMGLAVVATRIPGCIDAVQDGVTGTLVPARNAEALALAIQKYLMNPSLREQHGAAAREFVLREFRQEAIWAALYQEYLRLLQEKGCLIQQELKASL